MAPGSSPSSALTRRASLVRVALAYLAAFVAGALTVVACAAAGWGSIYLQLGLADLVATAVIFVFSYLHDNSSFYDAYWSVIPIWIVTHLAALGWVGDSGANLVRTLLAVAGVGFWGARLTWNWARSWSGIDHEDWRYVDIRRVVGARWQWPVSFLAIHLFPTALVFLGCLPLFPLALEAGRPLGLLDGLAAVVTFGAVIIELVADNQLRDYVLHRKRPGETMTEGLWGWSRHPNYFGEASFWWGIALFGLAAVGWQGGWMIAGALAMTGLFQFVSIPLIEARMSRRRPDYGAVQARVSRLIPRPPRREG